MKKLLIIALLLIFALPQFALAQDSADFQILTAKGLVLEVEETYSEPPAGLDESAPSLEQSVKIKILSGPDKGREITTINSLDNPFNVQVKAGNKVFLYGETRNGQTDYFVRDFWHLDGLIIWSIILLLFVLLLGRKQGLKAIISLGISLLLIFAVLIPLVQNGSNPVLTTFLITLGITLITVLILTGFTKKALATIIGTMGGVLTAIIFSYLIDLWTKLNGLGTEDSRILALDLSNLNFKGLLFAGIVLGALGAVMDTAISIASGLEEVKKHNPHISSKKLISSGFQIGRDIMGSMLNTLIFAYVGASLALVLLLSAAKANLVEVLNYGFISEEIVRSIIGSLGLIATIPITAVATGLLAPKK